VTPTNICFPDIWDPYKFDESFDRINTFAYAVGSLTWTIVDDTYNVSPVFSVEWHRRIYTPGVEIRRNGATVYTETENLGGSNCPLRYTIEYATPEHE
jgi:hypothetical protein